MHVSDTIILAVSLTLSSLCNSCQGGYVVVDTDCGGDDAMALFMLLSDPSTTIAALTTVRGNTGIVNVTRNVKAVLSVANKSQIHIYSGTDSGIATFRKPTSYYGDDGLGDFLPPVQPTNHSAPGVPAGFYLAELVRQNPGHVTVVALGPLTNLAVALKLNPNFIEQSKRVVILGGSFRGLGNQVPGVEANFYGDPDAASYYFSFAKNPEKTYIIGIEPIVEASFPMSWRTNILGKLGSKAMDFMNKAERIGLKNDGEQWTPYDPAAAAFVINEKIAQNTMDTYVQVERTGELLSGALVADFTHLLPNRPNARLITNLNRILFKNILLQRLS